jgi:hypothetical protein
MRPFEDGSVSSAGQKQEATMIGKERTRGRDDARRETTSSTRH